MNKVRTFVIALTLCFLLCSFQNIGADEPHADVNSIIKAASVWGNYESPKYDQEKALSLIDSYLKRHTETIRDYDKIRLLGKAGALLTAHAKAKFRDDERAARYFNEACHAGGLKISTEKIGCLHARAWQGLEKERLPQLVGFNLFVSYLEAISDQDLEGYMLWSEPVEKMNPDMMKKEIQTLRRRLEISRQVSSGALERMARNNKHARKLIARFYAPGVWLGKHQTEENEQPIEQNEKPSVSKEEGESTTVVVEKPVKSSDPNSPAACLARIGQFRQLALSKKILNELTSYFSDKRIIGGATHINEHWKTKLRVCDLAAAALVSYIDGNAHLWKDRRYRISEIQESFATWQKWWADNRDNDLEDIGRDRIDFAINELKAGNSDGAATIFRRWLGWDFMCVSRIKSLNHDPAVVLKEFQDWWHGVRQSNLDQWRLAAAKFKGSPGIQTLIRKLQDDIDNQRKEAMESRKVEMKRIMAEFPELFEFEKRYSELDKSIEGKKEMLGWIKANWTKIQTTPFAREIETIRRNLETELSYFE